MQTISQVSPSNVSILSSHSAIAGLLLLAVVGKTATVMGSPLPETKIVPGDSEPEDEFGFSVSLSAGTMVVGAPRRDEIGENSGASYIFTQQASGTWAEVEKLVPSDLAADDSFGWSAAISGDTVIVSSRDDDDGGRSAGSAYIFQRDQNSPLNWEQVAKLTASDPAEADQFGYSVAIYKNTAVVGAFAKDGNGGDRSGAAYIFERNSGGSNAWGEVAKLTVTNGTGFDLFGYSVAVSEDTVLIGAPADDNFGDMIGATYIYQRDASHPDGWRETQKLILTDSAPQNKFGGSVSLSQGIAVVGAYWDDENGDRSGAAYAFEQDPLDTEHWTQVAKLLPDDGAAADWFGSSVGISDDLALVGSYRDDDNGPQSGSAYFFERDFGGVNNWGQLGKVTGTDTAAGDNFGYGVAVSGSVVVAGAPGDGPSGNGAGKVYSYIIPEPSTFTLVALAILGLGWRQRMREALVAECPSHLGGRGFFANANRRTIACS